MWGMTMSAWRIHVYGLFFEQGEGGFSAIGFKADEPKPHRRSCKVCECSARRRHEQTDAEFFLAERGFAE